MDDIIQHLVSAIRILIYLTIGIGIALSCSRFIMYEIMNFIKSLKDK